MTDKDGGPAFPSHGSMGEVAQEGMTLRDYFAGQAIAGGVCFEQEDGCIVLPDEAARLAYAFADAMLKARGS